MQLLGNLSCVSFCVHVHAACTLVFCCVWEAEFSLCFCQGKRSKQQRELIEEWGSLRLLNNTHASTCTHACTRKRTAVYSLSIRLRSQISIWFGNWLLAAFKYFPVNQQYINVMEKIPGCFLYLLWSRQVFYLFLFLSDTLCTSTHPAGEHQTVSSPVILQKHWWFRKKNIKYSRGLNDC